MKLTIDLTNKNDVEAAMKLLEHVSYTVKPNYPFVSNIFIGAFKQKIGKHIIEIYGDVSIGTLAELGEKRLVKDHEHLTGQARLGKKGVGVIREMLSEHGLALAV